MHLDAEVAFGIDELDEQRQLAVVFLTDGLAKNSLRILIYDCYKVFAFQFSITNDAVLVGTALTSQLSPINSAEGSIPL
jgi:hypothetical protein